MLLNYHRVLLAYKTCDNDKQYTQGKYVLKAKGDFAIKKKQDVVISGVIIGLLADAVKLLVNFLGYLFGFTNVVFWQITASKFVDKDSLFLPVAYLIGATADLIVSATLGVAFLFFIHFLGKQWLWIKGAGFGLVVWVSLFGTLLGQSVQEKLPQTPAGIMVTIFAHLSFGLTLAFFFRLYSERVQIK